MASGRSGAALSGWLALCLAGCSGPVGVYHKLEGGAIAQVRQPPPGADLPYPNLADVPAAQTGITASGQQAIAQQAAGATPGVSPASTQALTGLALPGAPPPLPDVPGLNLPPTPSTPPAAPPPPAPAPSPNSAPVAIAFPPDSAVLPADDAAAIAAIATQRNGATVLAGGFGDDTSLILALARARRVADALTAAGVPASAIRLSAMAAGSGGFVQLVYETPTLHP